MFSLRDSRLFVLAMCAFPGPLLLPTGFAVAQPGSVASESVPVFEYPVARDPEGYFPGGLPEWSSPPLGAGPFDLQSYEHRDLRVVVLARGFSQPRSLAFLPSGDLLITERAGSLLLFEDAAGTAVQVGGVPEVVRKGTMAGLMDIALHPEFAENGWIFLSYHKPVYDGLGSNAIWRGELRDGQLENGTDVFVADDVDMEVSRIEFGADGKLYMTIGSAAWGPAKSVIRAQDGADFAGKTIRLNDDGSIPRDNPFADSKRVNPEVFTLGHRNQLGLAVNPQTGELWASEQGPNGGDEINILWPGKNYGWPLVSEGRDYLGPYHSDIPHMDGMLRPHVTFNPSPALSGMVFYTGERFPAWKNNLFVGALRFGEIPRTGHLLRIVFNEDWQETRREMLLVELQQRIRDVAQGPDGLLYLVTAEDDAALLRLEPR